MSYNMTYTSLPTFTENSIGYIIASQNYTTSYSGGINPVFSVSVIPGIYLFTSCVNILPGGLSDLGQLSFNLTNTTNSQVICNYNSATYNGLDDSQILCGTLSQVFPITITSTLTFTITYPTNTPDAISYSLVRIG